MFRTEDDRREMCVQDPHILRFSINSFWSTVSELPPESKANAQTITKSGSYVHFAPGSHFGEEQAKQKANSKVVQMVMRQEQPQSVAV